MKISFPVSLIGFVVLWIPSVATAQSIPLSSSSEYGMTAYPWRGQSAAERMRRGPTPLPPIIRNPNEPVHFFQASIQDQTQQPAAGDFSQGVPNPPANTGQGAHETQLPLSVQSNAINENGYLSSTSNCDWCRLGDPQRLFGSTPGGFTIGGFGQAGYHTDNSPGTNNREGQFDLHQGWFFVGREACRGANWDLGFRVDMMYGIDGQDFQATGNAPTGAPTGWDNSWDYGSYGWALPQAYVEFGKCDWVVRAGRFLSPLGYDSVPSIDNFFYSRTYLRTFTEPNAHTGILAQRDVASNLTYLAGLTVGWDTGFDRNNSGFNAITGIRYQPQEYVKLGVTSSMGDTGVRDSGVLSVAYAELQLTQNWCYVIQGDYLSLQGNDEFGIVNSLFYQVNRCLAFGGRYEWWKSDQFFTTMRSTYDWTFGANYRPHSNIVIRPELRGDWGAAAVDPGNTIFGVDAIIAF